MCCAAVLGLSSYWRLWVFEGAEAAIWLRILGILGRVVLLRYRNCCYASNFDVL